MNIHFLCKRFYTNKDLINDQFGRLYHLPIYLAQRGNKVVVDAIDYRNQVSTRVNSSNVSFVTLPATLTNLPKLIPSVYKNLRCANPDVLIASGDSHIGYIGLQIARRLGIRFVFDVYDYYPVFFGNRIPGMKLMFSTAVRKADLVLCASTSLESRLSNINPNTLLIENGVDRTLFTSGDMKQARIRVGLDEEFVLIGYFGSITMDRGPLLIEACRKLRESIPSLRLVLAGKTTKVLIDEPWIRYLGECSQASVPDLIRACNIVTIPYANDTFNSMAGACKIAEYLACRKPVVATNISGHQMIFKDAPESLCEPDVDDMVRALQRQLTKPVIAPFPKSMEWESIGRVLINALDFLQR